MMCKIIANVGLQETCTKSSDLSSLNRYRPLCKETYCGASDQAQLWLSTAKWGYPKIQSLSLISLPTLTRFYIWCQIVLCVYNFKTVYFNNMYNKKNALLYGIRKGSCLLSPIYFSFFHVDQFYLHISICMLLKPNIYAETKFKTRTLVKTAK